MSLRNRSNLYVRFCDKITLFAKIDIIGKRRRCFKQKNSFRESGEEKMKYLNSNVL
jgi:hypothetical protein